MNKREKYLHRMESMKAFIRQYWTENHFSPDTQEIRAALGNLSTSMVSFYRDRLEQEGWLEKSPRPRLPRSFVPTEIFANRPVFPSDGASLQDQDDFVAEDTPIIPWSTVAIDDRHAPMIHYEKE